MKNSIWLFLCFLIIVSCKNKNSEEISQVSICTKEAVFGDTTFCLPQLKGFTEGYKNDVIKKILLPFENEQTKTLAYYIPDAVFNTLIKNKDTVYDNYYKVYAPIIALNYSMTPFEMNEVLNNMANGMREVSLEKLEEKLQDPNFLSPSTPILLERYSKNEKQSTVIALMEDTSNQKTKANAVAITALLVKDRLVFVAHYLDYKNEQTISTLKTNNANFIESFLAANLKK